MNLQQSAKSTTVPISGLKQTKFYRNLLDNLNNDFIIIQITKCY